MMKPKSADPALTELRAIRASLDEIGLFLKAHMKRDEARTRIDRNLIWLGLQKSSRKRHVP